MSADQVLFMRAVVVFFLSFCFLLATLDYPVAGSFGNSCNSAVLVSPKHVSNAITAVQKGSSVRDHDHFKPKPDLLNIEDEDEYPASAPQYVLLANCVLAPVCVSVLDQFHSYIESSLPFCEHLSRAAVNAFIIQRVIRI